MERTHYNNFVVISQSPGEWFHTGQNMSAERERGLAYPFQMTKLPVELLLRLCCSDEILAR